MDKARGGQFATIPATYPAGAVYTYNDSTCNYNCMCVEYFYWIGTTIMGGQDEAKRAAKIAKEWKLETKAKVQAQAAGAYAIWMDATYKLPKILPNGVYTAGTAPKVTPKGT